MIRRHGVCAHDPFFGAQLQDAGRDDTEPESNGIVRRTVFVIHRLRIELLQGTQYLWGCLWKVRFGTEHQEARQGVYRAHSRQLTAAAGGFSF
jgi:hypothetical protein